LLSRFLILALLTCFVQAVEVRDSRAKMGSPFEITVLAESEAEARHLIEAAFAEIDRLEAMISSWQPQSQTSAINRAAGGDGVVVSQELFNLIRRSLKISQLTDGAFDITFAGVGNLWDLSSGRLPNPMKVKQALALVDYHAVELNPKTREVRLSRPGVRIGFGAIGKGYAANRAIVKIRELGGKSALVNAGGDMVATGVRENGRPWSILIADPRAPDRVFAELALTEQAVVTSGDYERFMIVDGKRYSHIINPKTGYPVDSLQSATVICPDGELADGLATSIFVMGPVAGMDLINRLPRVECILVDAQGRIHYSHNIQSQLIVKENSP